MRPPSRPDKKAPNIICITINLSTNKINKLGIFSLNFSTLNTCKINQKIKPTSDFNILWKRLMKIKQLYVSDVEPKNWYTVDNIENYRNLKKNTKNI